MLRSDISFGRRRMLTCQISDGTGILTMRFFNFNAAMKNSGHRPPRDRLWRDQARQPRRGNHPSEYRIQGEASEVELQGR